MDPHLRKPPNVEREDFVVSVAPCRASPRKWPNMFQNPCRTAVCTWLSLTSIHLHEQMVILLRHCWRAKLFLDGCILSPGKIRATGGSGWFQFLFPIPKDGWWFYLTIITIIGVSHVFQTDHIPGGSGHPPTRWLVQLAPELLARAGHSSCFGASFSVAAWPARDRKDTNGGSSHDVAWLWLRWCWNFPSGGNSTIWGIFLGEQLEPQLKMQGCLLNEIWGHDVPSCLEPLPIVLWTARWCTPTNSAKAISRNALGRGFRRTAMQSVLFV